MALEMNDIMTLKALGNDRDGLSPYEQFKVGSMQSRRPSGTAIAGLAVAIGGAVAGVAGWFYAHSQAKKAQDVAAAKNDGLRDLVTTLASTVAAERNERIAGDLNITTTINDSVSGSQQGSVNAQIEANAMAQAQTTLLTQAMLGNLSENAQKVQLYSAPQPCGCPGSCGCNG